MEVMLEQLGLQLRASQDENLRLGQELYEARKEPSRYGTPEERSSSGKGKIRVDGHLMGSGVREDGVVTQQAKGLRVASSTASKRKAVSKEGGTVVQQAATKEDRTAVQQAVPTKEDGAAAQQVRSMEGWTQLHHGAQGALSDGNQSDQSEGSHEGGGGEHCLGPNNRSRMIPPSKCLSRSLRPCKLCRK